MRRLWLCFVNSNDFFAKSDAEYRNYATFADGLERWGKCMAKTQGGRKYEVFSHGIADGRSAVGGR